jgi:hypothetical protein
VEIEGGEVERAFGREVSSYTVTPIDPQLRIHSVTGGVFRVVADHDSLVCKVVRHGDDPDPGALWVSGAEPSHRNYWKREWLAYDSGLLDGLPGELRAPRTALTTTAGPDECRIWMEDVEGRPGAEWPVADYASAAFDLGTTQGAYTAGHPLPEQEWLSRHWLRAWVDTLAKDFALVADAASWDADLLADLLPLRERAAAAWRSRSELLDIVAAAPATVVHLDLWPTNLIAADDGTTVAVDWSQIGLGALAQDLDQLILDPVWMQVLPDTDPCELEAVVVPAYLAGLRSAGAQAGEDDLDRWYAAAAGVHYLGMLGATIRTVGDPDALARLERRWSRPVEAILADRARVIERAVSLCERALESAG